MSSDHHLLGTLATADGRGVVRLEERYDTDIEDLWSALTEPSRLARWIAPWLEGDLRPGGEFRARFTSGWEGSGRIEACERPCHLRIVTRMTDASDENVVEATLTADGDHTVLVVQESGMPREQLAGYGAGWQVHLEDLGAHLSGRERCDIEARWSELMAPYEELVG